MFAIHPCPLPPGALLAVYAERGAYTDCYRTELAGSLALAQFVTAFYTTAVFKLERLILKWAIARPSTDAQAAQLAEGTIDRFAAWQVEGRREDQLLLSDIAGRTRSWLMVEPLAGDAGATTRLYFGSAVVPRQDAGGGKARLEPRFQLMLGFHKAYSKVLLAAARARLRR